MLRSSVMPSFLFCQLLDNSTLNKGDSWRYYPQLSIVVFGVSDAIDNFGSCVEFRIQLRYNKSSNDKKGKINKFVLKMRGMGTRTVVDFAFSMFFVI